MKALDAGCGAGAAMRLLGRIVGSQGRVTGLDADAILGASTLAWLTATEPSRFDFVVGDIGSPGPIPGAPFDFCLARMVLSGLVAPSAGARGLADCVRPGGILLVMEIDLAATGLLVATGPRDDAERVGRRLAGLADGVRETAPEAILAAAGLTPLSGTAQAALLLPIAEGGPILRDKLDAGGAAAAARGDTDRDEIDEMSRQVAALEGGPHPVLVRLGMTAAWTRTTAD